MARHRSLGEPELGAANLRPEVCVAVVHASDAVLLVAAGRNRTDVMFRLVDWMAEQASLHLWDEDAKTFNALVSQGDVEGAVRFYFQALEGPGSRVRWERQWLVVQSVSLSGKFAAPA